jgi:hypothetical protein
MVYKRLESPRRIGFMFYVTNSQAAGFGETRDYSNHGKTATGWHESGSETAGSCGYNTEPAGLIRKRRGGHGAIIGM